MRAAGLRILVSKLSRVLLQARAFTAARSHAEAKYSAESSSRSRCNSRSGYSRPPTASSRSGKIVRLADFRRVFAARAATRCAEPVRNSAFSKHSRNSSAALESITMPLPAPIVPRSPSSSSVRMATLKTVCRGEKKPIAPVYTPRGASSSSSNKLHGPHLGRARDRPAGKQRAEDVVEARLRPQFGADRRGHLPERGVALDGEELFHAARFPSAPRGPGRCAPGRRSSRFRCGFSGRLCSHSAISRSSRVVRPRRAVPFMGRVAIRRPPLRASPQFDAEEQLRRKREDVTARLPVQKRSVVDRLPRAQPRVERRGATLRLNPQSAR